MDSYLILLGREYELHFQSTGSPKYLYDAAATCQVFLVNSHWITVGKKIRNGKIKLTVFDSRRTTGRLNDVFKNIIDVFVPDFERPTFRAKDIITCQYVQQQPADEGSCGLYALAFCHALAKGEDLDRIRFDTDVFASTLLESFRTQTPIFFPLQKKKFESVIV
jgi:hypothetical protein